MWKYVIVKLIYKKKGSRSNPSSYRPVSLTCIASKIMESIISRNMKDYLEENEPLSVRKHGYRHEKSTTTCLLQSLHNWTHWIDSGHDVDVIYFDFSKAFD